MKTGILILVLAATLPLSAQRPLKFTPANPVCFQNPMMPLKILDYFARHFPDATPYWGIEGKFYSVKFADPQTGLARALIYDREGNVIRCESEVSLSDCPLTLQQYYLRNFANERLRIWCFTEDGDKRYYLRRGSKKVWFDGEGNQMNGKEF